MSEFTLHTYDGTSWAQGLSRLCREGTEVRLHLTRSTIVGTIEKAGFDYLMLATPDGDQVLVKLSAVEAISRE